MINLFRCLCIALLPCCFCQLCYAETQMELNEQAKKEAKAADERLSTNYEALLKLLEPADQKRLAEAQRAWAKFRDKEAEFHARQYEDGSISPLIHWQTVTRLTKARDDDLTLQINEQKALRAATPTEAEAILAKPTEARLKDIVAKYNTIVRGKVVSVGMRPDQDDFVELYPWRVVVEVSEVLGGKLDARKIAVYIHSPTHEFGGEENAKDHSCVWALSMEEGKIQDHATPFPFHKFNDDDIALIKKLLRERKAKRE